MMRTLFLVGMLCVGCTASDADTAMETEPVGQTAALEGVAQASLAKLAGRIDVSRLALEPLEPIEQAPPFEGSAALAALKAATGGEYEVDVSNGVWRASNGTFSVMLDERTGRYNVEGGVGYDARLALVEDSELLDKAATLLGAFAADLPRELDLKHLGATRHIIADDVPEAEQNESERLGSKVFAIRTLGGLRVAGNRLVASYANDGRFHAVRGLWPTIDVARSKLRSSLTTDQVVARALEQLVAHNVNPDRADPIVLESFYELRPEGESWIAVLCASALVTSYNHVNEPGRRERHDFDI